MTEYAMLFIFTEYALFGENLKYDCTSTLSSYSKVKNNNNNNNDRLTAFDPGQPG